MTTRTLQIDPLTGGLRVKDGQLVLLSDGPAIAQAVGSALRFVSGEWFLDPSQGVPYFERILVYKPDADVIVSIFSQAIAAVQGINQVTSVQLRYNGATRVLEVAWSAASDVGQLVGVAPVTAPVPLAAAASGSALSEVARRDLALASKVDANFAALKAWEDAHTHSTEFGPTGVPDPSSPSFPPTGP